MKILALDSSGLVASVAVVEDDVLLGEYTVDYKKTHSQTLLPMLDALCRQIDLDKSTIDAIAVAAGPGSFTGLRIGSATAKGIGLALDKPIISVPTVEGLAYNLYGCGTLVCPLMDARRNQTYTGIYRFKNGEMIAVVDQCAVPLEDILSKLNELGEPVTFLGDGVPVFKDEIEEKCKVSHVYAPASVNRQRAASVASLGLIYARKGKMESADAHRPFYLRLSQAERERKERLERNAGTSDLDSEGLASQQTGDASSAGFSKDIVTFSSKEGYEETLKKVSKT